MWTLSPAAEAIRKREQASMNALLKSHNADPITEYELDLRLFRRLPFGDKVRHEFLIRCWNHESDTDIIEVDGVQNYWHVRMAKAFCRYKRITLCGCASSGKTHRAAAYAKTLWKGWSDGTSVYLSTTSAEAGEARTWGAMKSLYKADRIKIGKVIDSLRVITLDEEARDDAGEKNRDYRNGIRAVLIKTGADGKNVIGGICGRKNHQVLWVCDEMPFMDLGILDARVNLFSNPFAQFIGIGNAPEEGDPLYIDAEPFGPRFPDGWRSVDKDVHEYWPTKTGICLYFNGDKSPNILNVPRGKRGPFPKLMDWEKREEILTTAGGEDTPIFWKQFYGFPPSVDVPDKIITQKLITSNGADTEPLWEQPNVRVVAGLDLGFREDGDPCVIDFARMGKLMGANRNVMQFEKDGIVLNPSQTSKEAFEKQIAKRVIEECRSRGCHDLALDVTGDGGLLLQAIELESRLQNFKLIVVAVSFSGAAEDRVVIPGETRKAKDMFDRMVSQLWASLRVCIVNKVIYGMHLHSKAVSQLCSRRFSTDDKKRFSVEPKKEMKKRLKRSPDCFVAGTKITTIRGDIPIEDVGLGELVLTPMGYSPVIAIHRSIPEILHSVSFSDGSTLTGKGGHKIFTFDQGWVRLDALCLTNHLESVKNCDLWSILRSSHTRVENTGFKALVNTIKATRTGHISRNDFFIEWSGSSISEKSQMECTSITKTTSGGIIESRISNSRLDLITNATTVLSDTQIRSNWRNLNHPFRKQGRLQKHGTNQKTEGHGIENTLPKSPENSLSCELIGNAKSVELTTPPRNQIRVGFAPEDADRETTKSSERPMSKKHASYVAQNIRDQNISLHVVAPPSARENSCGEPVFNLTLATENAYYANGVLVANCADARVLACHLALKLGLSGAESIAKPKAPESPVERQKPASGYSGHGTRQLYGAR